ncbi:MAG: PA0069 family radical SAM protein [Planctomycetales bacterium]|nr:PA0069 family radical SAM protein [Planctomycetales bacterium]
MDPNAAENSAAEERRERSQRPSISHVGRAARVRPANRFERVHVEDDFADLDGSDELADVAGDRPDKLATEYIADRSQTIIAENHSPDVPFRFSINPYRGCEHGCAYCYARPGHEYLGYDGGLDFETKIVVKHQAAELLRRALARRSWQPEPIALSGVTDCYQPAERRFRVTRGCLEVMLDARQPATIITKNALVLRDLDVLGPMASHGLVHVFVSITTLDAELARRLEPRTATPQARLRTVRALADAHVPVGVMVAPIIPGLTDTEVPAILKRAAAAGAERANFTIVRLPLAVEPVFCDWLRRVVPDRADRVLAAVRRMRDGRLNTSEFGQRMRGKGNVAHQITQMFQVFATRYGLDRPMPPLDTSQFRRPAGDPRQRRLFD